MKEMEPFEIKPSFHMRDLFGKRFLSWLLAAAMFLTLSSNALAGEISAEEKEIAPYQVETMDDAVGAEQKSVSDTKPEAAPEPEQDTPAQVPIALEKEADNPPEVPAGQELPASGGDPVALAGAKPILYRDGLHYIEDDEAGTILLYCMNHKLAWPHDTLMIGYNGVPYYAEGYLTADYFESVEKYEEFMRRVTNLLYAGYPNNGADLYKIVTDEDLRIPTEEEFNNLLIPSGQLADEFPELKHYEFFYPAEPEELAVLSRFVLQVGKMSDSDTTPSGLTKSAITSMPFYKAAASMTTDSNEDPRKIFGNYYGADYFVTQEQAFGATQNALWKLLFDYKIEDNGVSTLNGVRLAEDLMKFSLQGEILTKEPKLNHLKLEGDLSFRYNAKDGLWHTGKLKLLEEEDYHGIYELTLPKGVTTLRNISYVYGNEEYELVSDHPIKSGEEFGIRGHFAWLEAFKQYSPTPDIEVNGKRFQRMAGSVLETTTLKGKLVQQDVEEGNLSVTKTVIGGNSMDSFSFELYLPNAPLSGTYGDVVFDEGTAYFNLTDGETKRVLNLPAGEEYWLRELGDGSFAVESENAKGVIRKDETIPVRFINTPLPDLTISKVVAGDGGERLRAFTITVEMKDADGSPLNGTYECYGSIAAGYEKDSVERPEYREVTFEEGRVQLPLCHGQQYTMKGLPYLSTYTVTEEDACGYNVSYDKLDEPAAGTLRRNRSIQIRNEKREMPENPPVTPADRPGKPKNSIKPTPAPTQPITPTPSQPPTPAPTQPITPAPSQTPTPAPTQLVTPTPTQPVIPTPSPTPASTLPSIPPLPSEPTLPAPNVREDTPKLDENVPQTGDATNLFPWFVLLTASGAGAISTFIFGLKKKNKNQKAGE